MNAALPATTATLIRRREAWLKKLAQIGPPLRGSLCTVQRGNHTAHQLTVSVQGKTHTVYVPPDMVEEVKTWILNYRQTQRVLRELAKINMAIIHRHVPESRAAGRNRAQPRLSR